MIRRLHESHNQHNYNDSPGITTGVCHGAAANWIIGIFYQNRYTLEATSQANLAETKRLTQIFTERTPTVGAHGSGVAGANRRKMVLLLKDAGIVGEDVIPMPIPETKSFMFRKTSFFAFFFKSKVNASIRAGLNGLITAGTEFTEETLEMEIDVIVGKVAESSLFTDDCWTMSPLNQLGSKYRNRLGKAASLKKIIKGKAVIIKNTGREAEAVVKHITDSRYPGVYMLMAGSHVMAASSRIGNYYFYDSQNGLFECSTADELYLTIKYFRSSLKDIPETGSYSAITGWRLKAGDGSANSEQRAENGSCSDWHNNPWLCVECTGKWRVVLRARGG